MSTGSPARDRTSWPDCSRRPGSPARTTATPWWWPMPAVTPPGSASPPTTAAGSGYARGAPRASADEIGESLGSVRRFRWVAGAYDESTRQRFSLSFSHFQAVASLDDSTTWLERAQRGGWSVDRLATTARGANTSPPAPHVAFKASVEAVAKKVSSLNEADDRLLARAVRAGLADAVEELAEQVERLRARLRKAQRRSMSVAR